MSSVLVGKHLCHPYGVPMNPWLWSFSVWLLLAGCASAHSDIDDISISGFHSEEPERCRSSDVALDEQEVVSFFKRAVPIDGPTLHDKYDWAPCYLEGTLKYQGKSCIWRLRPGATAQIACPATEQHFGCKDCADLFEGTKQ